MFKEIMKKEAMGFIFVLGILFLVGSVFSQEYYQDYSDVLLICNNASTISQEICSYFISQRTSMDFNSSHVVNLTGVSTSETISDSEYAQILSQIQSWLGNNSGETINYMITTKGVPLRTGDRSVDSKLMNDLGATNNYYWRADIFTHSSYGGYLITRLDGLDVNDSKKLIDSSTSVQTNGLTGNVLLNCYSSTYSGSYNSDCLAASSVISSKGYTSEYNDASFLRNRNNLSGYVSWGSNAGCGTTCSNSSGWNLSFNPGALAETYVSTSARTLLTYPWTSGQSLISDLIKFNVTGVKGYVYEPYTYALAEADVLWDRYLSGYNLADSYYMASSMRNWMDVIIGDPKTYIGLNALVMPVITLETPEEGERVNNGTFINFTIYSSKFSNIDSVWYNINSGINSTFASPYDLDTSLWAYGDYNVSVYVNNTVGNIVSKMINITINATNGTLPKYSVFSGNQTTNIKQLADRTNVTGLILHRNLIGKIDFFENVNVSGLDLNSYLEISVGRVSVNSSALSHNLNKSANITLYGGVLTSIVNPQILRNGIICNSTTSPSCYNFTSLNADPVIFNVSEFSAKYELMDNIVSECANISVSGTYTVVNNLTTTGSCFNISGSNVTINGNGYNITGDGGTGDMGFINSGFLSQITIKNFNKISSFGRGVSFTNITNLTIQNNTFSSTSSTHTYGIYLVGVNSSQIESNRIYWNSSGGESYGLYSTALAGQDTSNNSIFNNNLSINAPLDDGYGIYLIYGSSLINSSFTNISDNRIDLLVKLAFVGINVAISSTGTSNFNVIKNNWLSLRSTGTDISYGIQYTNPGTAHNLSIENNNLTVRLSNGYGFSISNTGRLNNLSLKGNILDLNGSAPYGLYFLGTGNSSNTVIFNETLTVTGTGSGARGISISPKNDTYFSQVRINVTTPNKLGYDVYLTSASSHNHFYDLVFLGNNYSIYVNNNGGINNSFINISYPSYSRGEFVGTGTAQLIRKWHYQAYVNDSLGRNVLNANVSAYNSSGDLVETFLTNSSGWTGDENLIEYTNSSGVTSYYSNYTLNITASGYDLQSSTINFTNNTVSYFTLTDNISPWGVISSPISATYTSSSVLLSATLNENGACLYSLNSGVTNNSLDTTDNLTFAKTISLAEGIYTVYFYCNDSFGNRNDTMGISFAIDTSTDDGGSGGGSIGGGQIWLGTYTLADNQILNGYSQVLGEKYRINFKLYNQTHNLGVLKVGLDKVNITVFSNPVNLTIASGEILKVNLTNTQYYDLYIKLNSIVDNKANITIKQIWEEILVSNSSIFYVNNCQPLNQANKNYMLQNNINNASANCIFIQGNNISFNCNYYSIKNSDLQAPIIKIIGNNNQIINCDLRASSYKPSNAGNGDGAGILISGNNNLIKNNRIVNSFWGINVYGSANRIENNFLSGNSKAIHFELNNNLAKNNLVSHNNKNQGWGLGVWRGFGNQFINNNVYSNNYGIVIYQGDNSLLKCNKFSLDKFQDIYAYGVPWYNLIGQESNKNITSINNSFSKKYIGNGAELRVLEGSCDYLDCSWANNSCVDSQWLRELPMISNFERSFSWMIVTLIFIVILLIISLLVIKVRYGKKNRPKYLVFKRRR